MKCSVLSAWLGLAVTAMAAAADFDSRRDDNWHQWRGPRACGYAPHANPPIDWDAQTNVKWKVELPGAGSATPIVWEDRIFMLTAVDTGREGERAAPQREPSPLDRRRPPVPTTYYQFIVMCLDRETGQVRWQQVAREEVPHEGHHQTHGFASASPTTDGRFLYASFGSRGIYCYDLDGELRWERDLGDMQTRFGFGEGTSPVCHQDRLIVAWDHEGESFITALDARTGETVWRTDRDEPSNWSTPLVVEHAGRTQVVANATNRARSYDLDTGELIWECGGQGVNAIPSPVARDGVVYCMSGYRGKALFAIPLSASGDLTGASDQIAWQHDRGTPYVPSPLLYGDLLYFTDANNAILSCLNATSGEPLIDRQRLQDVSSFYASPVGAADRVYLVSREGTTLVLRRGSDFEVLATNRLDEPVDASPVLVGDQMFLRSDRHLFCIQAD